MVVWALLDHWTNWCPIPTPSSAYGTVCHDMLYMDLPLLILSSPMQRRGSLFIIMPNTSAILFCAIFTMQSLFMVTFVVCHFKKCMATPYGHDGWLYYQNSHDLLGANEQYKTIQCTMIQHNKIILCWYQKLTTEYSTWGWGWWPGGTRTRIHYVCSPSNLNAGNSADLCINTWQKFGNSAD